jgi:hypothetical protein
MGFLSGYKTKIMAAVAILTGMVGVLTGDQSLIQFFGEAKESIAILWAGATALFLRWGIDKV